MVCPHLFSDYINKREKISANGPINQYSKSRDPSNVLTAVLPARSKTEKSLARGALLSSVFRDLSGPYQAAPRRLRFTLVESSRASSPIPLCHTSTLKIHRSWFMVLVLNISRQPADLSCQYTKAGTLHLPKALHLARSRSYSVFQFIDLLPGVPLPTINRGIQHVNCHVTRDVVGFVWCDSGCFVIVSLSFFLTTFFSYFFCLHTYMFADCFDYCAPQNSFHSFILSFDSTVVHGQRGHYGSNFRTLSPEIGTKQSFIHMQQIEKE